MRLLARYFPCSALLVVTLLILTAPARAISVISSLRSIDVGGSATTRSTPGAFVNSASGGNSNSSTGAVQDSSVSQNASLIHVSGNGSTSAQQAVTFTTSQLHVANSFLDTNFSPVNDASFIVTGILTVAEQAPLGGSPSFDSSSASFLLAESGGPTLFSFNSNGSFNQSGFLGAGKTYHLRIASGLSLQTREIFGKTNGWTIDFIASEVPEPSTSALVVLCCGAAFVALRRRGCGLQVDGFGPRWNHG